MSATGTIESRVAEFQTIGIGQLQESKTNPRQHFAKDALSDLTKSIAEKGVLVPLLVRPHGGKEIGQGPNGQGGEIVKVYEILAGARRYRAAQAAGLNSLPVLIRHLTDTQALEVQVIENLQRADVHPLEEAEGYKQLLEKGKYEIADLAAKVGKSESYIYQRLKLAELVPAAKKAFYEEKITAGHAILLARLQPKDQLETIKETHYNGGVCSVREMQSWIHEHIHLELKTAPWDVGDAELIPAAGSCVKCAKRTGANPQLFPDVKSKDVCTDPACFDGKMQTHLVQIEKRLTRDKQRVVRLTMAYTDRKKDGVFGANDWRLAETNAKCDGLAIGLVVEGGWNRKEYRRGAQLRVCINKTCKAHWGSNPDIAGMSSRGDAATKAKERKTRALEAARVAALTQIAAKIKLWNLTTTAVRFAARTTFDGQKLACKVLGIWPKDGKIGNFDFRAKLAAHIQAIKGPRDVHQVFAVLSLIPEYGRWGDGSYGDDEEVPALRAAGKSVGVNVEKLEREYVAAAQAKAAKKTKPAKAQTSAKKIAKAKAA